jgi:hypothetical protein
MCSVLQGVLAEALSEVWSDEENFQGFCSHTMKQAAKSFD